MSDGTTNSSSESEFEPGYASKRGKKKKHKGTNKTLDSDYVRTTGRSKGVVSYKDFYGGSAGEESGEGGEEKEEGEEVLPLVEDNRETIEKILKKRVGRIGGKSRLLGNPRLSCKITRESSHKITRELQDY